LGIPQEHSAGGVVIRWQGEKTQVAVIRPASSRALALPKGHMNPGESCEEAAERELWEETGIRGKLVEKLADIGYRYSFRGRSISKIVSFFLFVYEAGEINQLEPAMRKEVTEALWMDTKEGLKALSYPGERDMLAKAMERLEKAAI
jgi:8-oxo-dGTP pyrophosphatase MutT (NUDIX family)